MLDVNVFNSYPRIFDLILMRDIVVSVLLASVLNTNTNKHAFHYFFLGLNVIVIIINSFTR